MLEPLGFIRGEGGWGDLGLNAGGVSRDKSFTSLNLGDLICDMHTRSQGEVPAQGPM